MTRDTRNCGAMTAHRRLLNRYPTYRANRAEIETQTLRYQRRRTSGRSEVATIPVVVHVVHHTDEQDISDEQIASQIDVLNRDYRAANADIAGVPEVWRDLVGDVLVHFELATTDPVGSPTDGIVRTPTHVSFFTDDDVVKFSARGGSDAWPTASYLNIWVCPMLDLLGYAQFPGGPTETDGVVIDFTAFGTIGTAAEPFHLGRTATHEIGHWLNLYHIWGDDGLGCAGSDLVDDTPNQAGPNTGVPTFPKASCGNEPNGDMFVNFLDYTDDAGMAMFTSGQVLRMHAALDGPRSSNVVPSGPAQEPTGPVTSLGVWQHADLTAEAHAPDAAGDPVVAVESNGSLHVFYRGLDEHIHSLRASGSRAADRQRVAIRPAEESSALSWNRA
jgi:hypothetical protein